MIKEVELERVFAILDWYEIDLEKGSDIFCKSDFLSKVSVIK